MLTLKTLKGFCAFICLVFSLTLTTSCSKKDNETTEQSSDSTTQTETYSASIYKSYQYVDREGCDTLKHEFQGESRFDVMTEFCSALVDHGLNNYCAEYARKNAFVVHQCKKYGFSWNPSGETELRLEDQVIDSVSNRLVADLNIAENLEQNHLNLAQRIANDFLDCGLNYRGPRCLNYHGSAVEIELQSWLGSRVFRVSLLHSTYNEPLVFVFPVREENNVLVADSLDVYLNTSKNETATSHSSRKLFSIRMEPNTIETAIQRMRTPSGIREMYHLAQLLEEPTEQGNIFPEHFVITSILNNLDLIKDAKEELNEYQHYLYRLLRRLTEKKQDLIAFSEALLTSKIKTTRQFAATEILLLDSSRKELKPAVRSALRNHPLANTRLDAARAIIEAHPNSEDVSVLIQALEDTDFQVRHEITHVLTFSFYTKKAEITSDHLHSLIEIATHSKMESAKETAIKLIGKIDGKKATTLLIKKLSDASYHVRKEAKNALKGRKLGKSDLSILSKQLRESSTDKEFIVTLIGKIEGDAATKVLIQNMSDDDYYARKELFRVLQNRELSNDAVEELAKQLMNSSLSETRIQAAKLLGEIKTKDSLEALLTSLEKEEDKRVGDTIVEAIVKVRKGTE